jgi:DNA polymerase
MAASAGLPRALGPLAQCLGLPQQKQQNDLVKRMCIPPYEDTPELRELMYEYCRQDVETERNVAAALPSPQLTELEDLHVNLIINRRGIPIDRELATLAQHYAHNEREALRQEVEYLTAGAVDKTAGASLRDWVYDNLPAPELMMRDGKRVLDRYTRQLLLDADLPGTVRDVLECSDEASRSSVSKFAAMLDRVEADGRVRGAFLMAGAGQTGRYSSTGLQVHNFPRKTEADAEAVIATMRAGRPLDDCMATLSRMLRPAIVGDLVWGDWSAIEGRVCPWLIDADEKLQIYRDGKDPYIEASIAMFGTPDQRQMGKVAELSLQFGGGVGALLNMARNYGLTPDDPKTVVNAWRRANPWAGTLQQAVMTAVHDAMRDPGVEYTAGRLVYAYFPGLLNNSLWCRLPSGRRLAYPGVRYDVRDELTALKGSRRPRKGEEWPRVKLWHGLLVENATQAVAADILRHALRVLVLEHNAPVIGHVHDEIVLEGGDRELLKTVMETPPTWAEGLPLKAEVSGGQRYGKG